MIQHITIYNYTKVFLKIKGAENVSPNSNRQHAFWGIVQNGLMDYDDQTKPFFHVFCELFLK